MNRIRFSIATRSTVYKDARTHALEAKPTVEEFNAAYEEAGNFIESMAKDGEWLMMEVFNPQNERVWRTTGNAQGFAQRAALRLADPA